MTRMKTCLQMDRVCRPTGPVDARSFVSGIPTRYQWLTPVAVGSD